MSKYLVFDTGPIISLAMNNLLWILHPLKEKFGGEFIITPGVKKECIDKPLSGKKFKFEAIQVMSLVEEGILTIHDSKDLQENAKELLDLSNRIFKARGTYVKSVQYAEIEAVAACKMLGADAVVIDEFITRALIENSSSIKKKMQKRLHTKVEIDKDNLRAFRNHVHDIEVVRSVELVTVGFEMGLFEQYYLNFPHPKHTVLEGLLWAIKLNGCSVSEQEIKELMQIEQV